VGGCRPPPPPPCALSVRGGRLQGNAWVAGVWYPAGLAFFSFATLVLVACRSQPAGARSSCIRSACVSISERLLLFFFLYSLFASCWSRPPFVSPRNASCGQSCHVVRFISCLSASLRSRPACLPRQVPAGRGRVGVSASVACAPRAQQHRLPEFWGQGRTVAPCAGGCAVAIHRLWRGKPAPAAVGHSGGSITLCMSVWQVGPPVALWRWRGADGDCQPPRRRVGALAMRSVGRSSGAAPPVANMDRPQFSRHPSVDGSGSKLLFRRARRSFTIPPMAENF